MNQSREEASRILHKARVVCADLHSNVLGSVIKVPKGEVRRLIRSPEWTENGFHLLERPDWGPRYALLSACANHEECAE